MEQLVFEFDKRLDTDLLKDLYMDDREHASIIFDQFLLSFPAELKELENFYNEGDITGFRKTIHKVKPGFSFVGLTKITAKAEVIEKLCYEIDDIRGISDQFKDLRDNLSEVLVIIQKESERLKA